jgi:hypothetical protein
MVPSAWRHAGMACSKDMRSVRLLSTIEQGSERNSLSGKEIGFLPHRPARDGREPAHIGEALPAAAAAGNPEGSPSDPVTTDPKGEAGRTVRSAIRRPSATQGAYGGVDRARRSTLCLLRASLR